MKKFLFLLFTVLLMSCNNDIDLFDSANVEKYKLTESIPAMVVDDAISILTFNGDTIYQGNVATSVEVPKTFTTSRNVYTGLEWHYVPNETGKYYYQKVFKGLALFEDIPNGDCDYNDFVCKIGYQIDVDVDGNGYINTQNGCGLKLSITGMYPLAMGNTIPLQFGIEIVRLDNNEYLLDELLYEDIRKEAFRNTEGFINTETKNFDTQNTNVSAIYNVLVPENLDMNGFAINIYIIANGKKHYTVNSTKAGLTQNMTPWGLYIPISDADYYNPNSIGFSYPKETISFFDTYPNFKSWVNGQNIDPFGKVITENLLQW